MRTDACKDENGDGPTAAQHVEGEEGRGGIASPEAEGHEDCLENFDVSQIGKKVQISCGAERRRQGALSKGQRQQHESAGRSEQRSHV